MKGWAKSRQEIRKSVEKGNEYWESSKDCLDIVSRFKEFKALKTTKLNLMRSIEKFLDPPDDRLLKRSQDSTPEQEILYDNTGMVVSNDHSHSSVQDLLNFSEQWFLLNSSKDFENEDQKNVIRKYLSKKTAQMFRFINRTSYPSKLIGDKINYDLYGFSGLTIFEDKD